MQKNYRLKIIFLVVGFFFLMVANAFAVEFYGKVTYRDGSKCGNCRIVFEHSGMKETFTDSSGKYSINMSGPAPMCVSVYYYNGSKVASNICANSSSEEVNITVK